MDILVLIAIVAVGASSLYVALSFNTRTKQVIDPLVNKATEDVCHQIETSGEELARQVRMIADARQRESERVELLGTASGELKQQVQAIADELRRYAELLKHRETTGKELARQVRMIADARQRESERVELLGTASGELKQQVQAIADELRRYAELLKQLSEQLGVRQDQFSSDLLQLDHRITQLIESVAQQDTQITEIRDYVKRQGKQAAQASLAKDSLLLAMLEAESHADSKGWGRPPHLYALIETTSPRAEDHEFADQMRDARLDTLIPVAQEQLPDGDLIDSLVNIHWPEDVAGCVLVTELVDLPPRSSEDTPIDTVATGQWASTHPDARSARLVVGVRRSGEYECGLRIKGEDDVQVRPELANDLVTALLGTF